jgi:hypothetical protein
VECDARRADTEPALHRLSKRMFDSAEVVASPGGERAEFRSFDELIRPYHQRRLDGQAERPRRLHVDHELKLGRLFDRQVGGLRTAEDQS